MPPVAQESLRPLPANSTTHIHEIYIKAAPGAIWDHITSPEFNGKYGYRGVSHYELKPGGKFKCIANAQMQSMGLPEVIVDGEVIEAKPPFKLVQTYRFLFNDAHKAEGFSRITFEIEQTAGGFCRLTVTHDTTGLPMMTGATTSRFDTKGGGGWNWILSDLKSLLETGKTMS
ncbi:MAG: SRPBCC domain-containing protein [Pseudomonadota bacterium]